MKKKTTNLIYYVAGCYGTFVEWACTSIADGKINADLPYTTTGSSHNFIGNPLWMPGQLFSEIESENDLAFARCHPVIFQQANSKEILHNNLYHDIVLQDISFLQEHYNNILVLHPTTTSRLWQENNYLQKVTITDELYNAGYSSVGYSKDFLSELFLTDFNKKIIETLRKEISDGKTMQWNKSSIHDMSIWELRELSSLQWFDRSKDMFTCWESLEKQFSNIKFMSLDCFRTNFCASVVDFLEYFNVKQPPIDSIKQIEADWRPRQDHINKDKDVELIIDSVINNFNHDWGDLSLTILDEAYIQKKLRDAGIKIKCHNLDKFPTNTKKFSLLLHENWIKPKSPVTQK